MNNILYISIAFNLILFITMLMLISKCNCYTMYLREEVYMKLHYKQQLESTRSVLFAILNFSRSEDENIDN